MRILLVNPPVPQSYYNREFYAPSSLLYLGAVLKKNGDEIQILDMKALKPDDYDNPMPYYEKTFINTVNRFKPELIGIGCLFSGNFPDLLHFSVLSKENFNEIPIVIGGIHPTIYAEKILYECPSIDWVILAEGEESIVQMVNRIKDGSYNFEDIDGFAYRKNGKIIVNPKTQYIQDLNSLPFPAYDLINIEDYYEDTSDWHNPKNLPINTSLPIISSRSCPNRCNFCSMYMVMGPRWRPRPPKNVVDEIEYLYNKYNLHHFSIMDDNFTLNKKRTLEICKDIIRRGLDIQFETPNGISINTLDGEVMNALVSAGLIRVYLAIESGSEYIRNKVMGKHLSTEKIYEIIDLTKQYKQLYVKAYFIIGMPEETHTTLEETYNMIKKINVDRIYLHNIIPFPGTKVFEQALRDNLLVDLDPESLYKSEELYITNYDRVFIKPYALEIEDLRAFRKRCNTLIEEQQRRGAKTVLINKEN